MPDSNHGRAYGATPFSSSGSSVTLIGLASPTSSNVPSSSARDKLQEVASLLPASDELFFEQLSSIKKDMEAKIRSWDALAAGNEKLFSAAKYRNAMKGLPKLENLHIWKMETMRFQDWSSDKDSIYRMSSAVDLNSEHTISTCFLPIAIEIKIIWADDVFRAEME